MAQDGWKVELYVYDLSQGLARQLSSEFLGKVIEAIWHTGVGVYGREYFFGGGIQSVRMKQNPYGKPVQVAELGTTRVPQEIFEQYLRDIQPRAIDRESGDDFAERCSPCGTVSSWIYGSGAQLRQCPIALIVAISSGAYQCSSSSLYKPKTVQCIHSNSSSILTFTSVNLSRGCASERLACSSHNTAKTLGCDQGCCER